MKDAKFSYTAVRIYSKDLLDRLQAAFERTENSFAANKSEFLVHLIELGLADYQKEITTKRDNPTGTALERATDIEDFTELLNQYITFARNENERSKESLKVCEGLSSSIYNILVEYLDGKFVDREAVEAGKYDKLPKRFDKIKVVVD